MNKQNVLFFWALLLLLYVTSMIFFWNSSGGTQVEVHTENRRVFDNCPPPEHILVPNPIPAEPVIVQPDYLNFVTKEEYQQTIESLLVKLTQATTVIKQQNTRLAASQPLPVEFVPQRVNNQRSEYSYRIATYNLWNLNGPWQERTKKIAELIQDSGIDIVALQEVRTIDGKTKLPLNTAFDFSNPSNSLDKIPRYPGGENSIQLQLLLSILPEFKYAVFIATAQQPQNLQEGIAVRNNLSNFSLEPSEKI
jgi:hypothetical protein